MISKDFSQWARPNTGGVSPNRYTLQQIGNNWGFISRISW